MPYVTAPCEKAYIIQQISETAYNLKIDFLFKDVSAKQLIIKATMGK